MPVILATQEAEIRRIALRSQPRENSFLRPYFKKTHHQKRIGGVAQGVGLVFKLQYHTQKNLVLL
jgi:hypothetical protein